MTRRLITCLLVCSLALPGCQLIYRQNIQQGNAIEQEDLDELYIGMNKRQVLFVLGTPSIQDPFHDDRWDYVQTYARRGGRMVQRTVTLRFEDDLLEQIIGADDAFAADHDMGIPTFPVLQDEEEEDSDGDGADADSDLSVSQPADDTADDIPPPDGREPADPDIDGHGERESDTRDYEDEED